MKSLHYCTTLHYCICSPKAIGDTPPPSDLTPPLAPNHPGSKSKVTFQFSQFHHCQPLQKGVKEAELFHLPWAETPQRPTSQSKPSVAQPASLSQAVSGDLIPFVVHVPISSGHLDSHPLQFEMDFEEIALTTSAPLSSHQWPQHQPA